MTPNDRNPNRYKNKTFISATLAALIAAGAGAPAIYKQLIKETESGGKVHTTAYYDGKRIATICDGLTRIYDRPVRITDKLTAAECDRLDGEEQAKGLAEMERLLGPDIWASLSPPAQAGLASWCSHNLGLSKCKDSTAIRELRAGRRNEACAAITLWIRDGGKDCRDRANDCLGQVTRRQLEDELCLIGDAP